MPSGFPKPARQVRFDYIIVQVSKTDAVVAFSSSKLEDRVLPRSVGAGVACGACRSVSMEVKNDFSAQRIIRVTDKRHGGTTSFEFYDGHTEARKLTRAGISFRMFDPTATQ